MPPDPVPDDVTLLHEAHAACKQLRQELAKVVIGQDKIIEELLIALLARGHALLVGVPGLAKTLLVHTLAQLVGLSFGRIQFTPDLMPSDITGTEVLTEDPQTRQREFRFIPGPVFAQLLLADEINRTPPKTQAALLEAMQEHQVTVAGRRHPLPEPFLVWATQNPIEQQGTYPLPEAQLDRFMFCLQIGYPSEEEECRIVRLTTGEDVPPLTSILAPERLQQFQALVRRIPTADHVIQAAVKLVRKTRPQTPGGPVAVRDYVRWGAGPRAAQQLILAAKARALLYGQLCVSTEDVKGVALAVLRHRLLLNFRAEAAGMQGEELLKTLVQG
jgi:MoxR-like ATPase